MAHSWMLARALSSWGNARIDKGQSSESVGAWNQMGRHGSLMMHGDTVQGLEVSSELAVAFIKVALA